MGRISQQDNTVFVVVRMCLDAYERALWIGLEIIQKILLPDVRDRIWKMSGEPRKSFFAGPQGRQSGRRGKQGASEGVILVRQCDQHE